MLCEIIVEEELRFLSEFGPQMEHCTKCSCQLCISYISFIQNPFLIVELACHFYVATSLDCRIPFVHSVNSADNFLVC